MVSRTDRGAHGAAGDAGTYGRFPVRVALGELGADIKANGLGVPIEFWQDGKDRFLIDGRNRLEAMERVGIEDYPATETCNGGSPLARIISLNIRRRHLTKEQQAELIVAAVKADAEPRQDGEVSDMDGEIPDDMLRILPRAAFRPARLFRRSSSKGS